MSLPDSSRMLEEATADTNEAGVLEMRDRLVRSFFSSSTTLSGKIEAIYNSEIVVGCLFVIFKWMIHDCIAGSPVGVSRDFITPEEDI